MLEVNGFSNVMATEAVIAYFKADAVTIFNHLGAQATYREEMRNYELEWNFVCVGVCVCARRGDFIN